MSLVGRASRWRCGRRWDDAGGRGDLRAAVARPGATGLFVCGFVARLPLTATAVVLTLYIALELRAVAHASFWAVEPLLALPVVVPVAFLAGLLALPAFSVVRQSIGATTPEALRRPAFALNAMSAEVPYIVADGGDPRRRRRDHGRGPGDDCPGRSWWTRCRRVNESR